MSVRKPRGCSRKIARDREGLAVETPGREEKGNAVCFLAPAPRLYIQPNLIYTSGWSLFYYCIRAVLCILIQNYQCFFYFDGR